MRNLVLFIGIIALLSPLKAIAEADVEYIIDISGSMVEKVGGVSKIDAAKKALIESINEINNKQLVALRVFAHRIDKSNKEESCKDTELLVPFKKLDKAEFISKVNSLQPKGWTLIAHSLEESRNDLLDVGAGREAEKIMILMTDGEETCGGDPIAVLKKLKDEGFKLTVHTVGFNVNELGRKQLKEIASFTGGKYFEASNVSQLNQSLKDAAKETVQLLNKSKKTYGVEIRGGDSYETATPIEYGKEYKLDHHQKKNDFDYFYVDLKKGNQLTIKLKTLEMGVHINNDGKVVENRSPYAGIQLHGSTRNRIKDMQIIGGAFANQEFSFSPDEDGRFYLLVGSVYEDTNKDHVNFQLDLESKGDLGADVDAGDTLETALKIEAKRYEKNFIGNVDDIDIFSIDLTAGDKLMLGIIPVSSRTDSFRIRLLSEFKEELHNSFSGQNVGMKTPDITIPESGKYYVEIKYGGSEQVEYTLVVKKKQDIESGEAEKHEGQEK